MRKSTRELVLGLKSLVTLYSRGQAKMSRSQIPTELIALRQSLDRKSLTDGIAALSLNDTYVMLPHRRKAI